MRCESCRHENPSGAKFCQECGGSLHRACAGCATQLPPTAKFCHECGRRTTPDASSEAAASAASLPSTPQSSTAAPTSFASGRYQLRALLGEGARKRVHVAWDTKLEREVAFSLIKAEGLDEAARLRVRREAQAMAQLGDHPHIATVHDIGEEGGQIFIVSEYMSGGDLEQRPQQEGDSRRMEPAEVLRIGTELCRALEHAHAHNVVHRDVKPGNVWIARDGSVKLGDFGLAVSTERTRLTHEGMMVGTAAYMAPEQALGRAPDARSDLYALGATLYELVTGRPPFLGDDAVAIISQHIHTPPVAPSWNTKDVPERLEALILDLLEKDPEKRPQTAAAVRDRLDTAMSASAETARVDEPSSANPLDRLASGVFVGREDALETLRAGVDDCLSARGSVLLLMGEPGIGKTRTSEELATYAHLRGAQVLWGHCYEGDGAPSYWPWMQVIRSYVHERDPQLLMSEMGSGAADIAEVVSEVRQQLPGLPVPPKLDPDQARFRLFDAITTFLRNASNQSPLVIVLDDLHWADEPSLLLMQFLARELGESRILLVGTYRDVEVGRQHPLEQTLAELARTQRAERVLLRGLTEDDVARFLALSVGRTPPEAMVEAVFRETEGNPFFVHEVVRLLQSDGRLDRPEEVSSWSVEIPQGVRQVIGRRLDGLGEACNEVLTVGSVIGREFELRVLAAAADRSEDETLELIEAAEDARVIQPVEARPGSWRFSHALVRETLYDEIRTTRRLRMHRHIGEVLEARHADHLEPHFAELAYHYCEAASGGDIDKAVDYAQKAAWRALTSVAYEEAANHYERALIALEAAEKPDASRRCELLLSQGDAHYRAGNGAAMQRAFDAALSLADAIPSPVFAALALIGRVRAVIPNSAADLALVARLERAVEDLGDEAPELRARLLARAGGQLVWGHSARASEALNRALTLFDADSDPLEGVLEIAMVQSSVSTLREQRAEALRRYQAIIDRAVAENDRGIELTARTYLSVNAATFGDADEVDAQLERIDGLTEALREPAARSTALRFRAHRALWQGDLGEARTCAWSARQLHGKVGLSSAVDQLFQVQLWGQRRLQGRLAETIETLETGVKAYPGAPIWTGLLACAYAESGRTQDAKSLFDDTRRDDFATLRQTSLNTPETCALLSEVCLAADDIDGAEVLEPMLLPYEELHIQVPQTVTAGAGARCLANLSTVRGRFDEAETRFDVAIALDRRMRAHAWLPRTQCDYARMLLTRSGPGDREKALGLLDEAMAGATERGLKGWLDRCLETKLAAQGVQSGSTSPYASIDVLAEGLGHRQPDLSLASASDGTLALLFSDVVGFTQMIERLGDHDAREVLRDHNRIVRTEVAVHGGREVEIQGDAFFLVFADPSAALRCSVSLQHAFAEYSASHTEPLRVRIGLHVGEALRDGERFFGRSVNLAARVAGQARGEEILVSGDLVSRVSDPSPARFGASRSVTLKGIAEPQEIRQVDWR
jgi:serine/threonine protein kinase/class 3 adenylate cyclase